MNATTLSPADFVDELIASVIYDSGSDGYYSVSLAEAYIAKSDSDTAPEWTNDLTLTVEAKCWERYAATLENPAYWSSAYTAHIFRGDEEIWAGTGNEDEFVPDEDLNGLV